MAETKAQKESSPATIELASLDVAIANAEEVIERRKHFPKTDENQAILNRRERELAGMKERHADLKKNPAKVGAGS